VKPERDSCFTAQKPHTMVTSRRTMQPDDSRVPSDTSFFSFAFDQGERPQHKLSCFQPQTPVEQATGPNTSLASILDRAIRGHVAKQFKLHSIEHKLNSQRIQMHMELTGRNDMRFR
jgi:hypothetical protein